MAARNPTDYTNEFFGIDVVPTGETDPVHVGRVLAGTGVSIAINEATRAATMTMAQVGYGLSRVRILAASGTYVPTTGVRAALVACLGAGSAGGSCATGATNSAAAGGGSAGGYSLHWIDAVEFAGHNGDDGFLVIVGAGGSPGAAGANAGGDGGNTAFQSLVGSNICVAVGGRGGQFDTVAAGPRMGGRGVAPLSQGIGNLLTVPGAVGGTGICFSATQAQSGRGAASNFGGGADSLASQSDGVSGAQLGGIGCGGSGGCILSGGASVQGGAGAPGLIIVWEYF